jgi:hypothetical protein
LEGPCTSKNEILKGQFVTEQLTVTTSSSFQDLARPFARQSLILQRNCALIINFILNTTYFRLLNTIYLLPWTILQVHFDSIHFQGNHKYLTWRQKRYEIIKLDYKTIYKSIYWKRKVAFIPFGMEYIFEESNLTIILELIVIGGSAGLLDPRYYRRMNLKTKWGPAASEIFSLFFVKYIYGIIYFFFLGINGEGLFPKAPAKGFPKELLLISSFHFV